MNIVFMGTPDFAVPALDALAVAGHRVIAVYTQPPRPAGRGQKEQPSPVPPAAAAYGLTLPKAILDAPLPGCLNTHPSLLPRWRGAAPIQRAIEAGDAETGVCLMQMEKGLDTGPVLLRQSLAIGDDETAGQLHDRLAALGAQV